MNQELITWRHIYNDNGKWCVCVIGGGGGHKIFSTIGCQRNHVVAQDRDGCSENGGVVNCKRLMLIGGGERMGSETIA